MDGRCRKNGHKIQQQQQQQNERRKNILSLGDCFFSTLRFRSFFFVFSFISGVPCTQFKAKDKNHNRGEKNAGSSIMVLRMNGKKAEKIKKKKLLLKNKKMIRYFISYNVD